MHECRIARLADQELRLFNLKSTSFNVTMKETYNLLILRNFIEHHKCNDLDVKM